MMLARSSMSLTFVVAIHSLPFDHFQIWVLCKDGVVLKGVSSYDVAKRFRHPCGQNLFWLFSILAESVNLVLEVCQRRSSVERHVELLLGLDVQIVLLGICVFHFPLPKVKRGRKTSPYFGLLSPLTYNEGIRSYDLATVNLQAANAVTEGALKANGLSVGELRSERDCLGVTREDVGVA